MPTLRVRERNLDLIVRLLVGRRGTESGLSVRRGLSFANWCRGSTFPHLAAFEKCAVSAGVGRRVGPHLLVRRKMGGLTWAHWVVGVCPSAGLVVRNEDRGGRELIRHGRTVEELLHLGCHRNCHRNFTETSPKFSWDVGRSVSLWSLGRCYLSREDWQGSRARHREEAIRSLVQVEAAQQPWSWDGMERKLR